MGNENLGSALDRWLLGRNYSWHYVTTNAIPATATLLFGVMTGTLLRSPLDRRRICRVLLTAGTLGVTVGLALSPWVPMVKRIWTASFALFAGGGSVLMLLGFYWVMDVLGHRRWAYPLEVVGMNSIAAYVLENVFGGWFRSLSGAWIAWLNSPLGPIWFPVLQHALFALSAWGVLHWFHRRRIYFKL